MRRERLSVVASEPVGPYTLLRVRRGGIDPGLPRPVLHARGAWPPAAPADEPLPRPPRRARVPGRSHRPGNQSAVCARPGRAHARPRPARKRLRPRPRATSARRRRHRDRTTPIPRGDVGSPPAVLGFRSDWHAEAAALVPNAQVCVEPTLVTELIPAGLDVFACGPEPMLEAVRAVAPTRSSRGKRRWPAATARATAARSRSAAS